MKPRAIFLPARAARPIFSARHPPSTQWDEERISPSSGLETFVAFSSDRTAKLGMTSSSSDMPVSTCCVRSFKTRPMRNRPYRIGVPRLRTGNSSSRHNPIYRGEPRLLSSESATRRWAGIMLRCRPEGARADMKALCRLGEQTGRFSANERTC